MYKCSEATLSPVQAVRSGLSAWTLFQIAEFMNFWSLPTWAPVAFDRPAPSQSPSQHFLQSLASWEQGDTVPAAKGKEPDDAACRSLPAQAKQHISPRQASTDQKKRGSSTKPEGRWPWSKRTTGQAQENSLWEDGGQLKAWHCYHWQGLSQQPQTSWANPMS